MLFLLLLTTLEGQKLPINFCSKPVHNLKGDYLHKILIWYLVKAKECGFDMVPIIFDRASENAKVAKKIAGIIEWQGKW